MKIVELGGQFQCRLEDGSVVTITTTPMTPSKDLTVEALHKHLTALGGDTAKKVYNSSILQANALPNGMKLYMDE